MNTSSILGYTGKYITYLRLINLIPFVVTFIFTLACCVFFDFSKHISLLVAVFASTLTNPSLIFGAIYFLQLRRFTNLARFELQSEINIEKAFKLKYSLEKKADVYSKHFAKFIYLSYLLLSFELRFSHPAKHVNGANDYRTESIHKTTLATSKYFHEIGRFVLAYFFGSPGEIKKNSLEELLRMLPPTISRDFIRNMLLSTHNDDDGETFLSTLLSLYNLFLCSLLPVQLQERVLLLFEETTEQHDKLGWLSHRFFEYILVSKCSGLEEEKIKDTVLKHRKMYRGIELRKKFDGNIEKVKYHVRDLLLKKISTEHPGIS
uniref:Uncharacterized protein n=1 Tax=Candidatus Kentrum sp. LPFa TaxID=2126335 RepID=A0A450WMS7_9GAMM|nr:MAG: hypothetical protein BECKLPF1236B_GA0070989_11395 [Candidatus Kentron sp. LPFa]